MKYARAILFLAMLIAALPAFSAHAKDAPATADELLNRFQAALQSKNTDSMMELFDWQGVSEEMKGMQQQFIGTMFSEEVKSVKLSPLPAGFRLEFERNGIRYRPNVTVVGIIDIEFAQKGNSVRKPYGKKNDAFYLANTLEERIYQPVTKEISLNVAIDGTVLPEPATFEGFYVYLKGGKEIRERIIDTLHKGNLSQIFWGDRIKSCIVWKTSAKGQIRLVISEDGKEVFRSEWETRNKPIVYEVKLK